MMALQQASATDASQFPRLVLCHFPVCVVVVDLQARDAAGAVEGEVPPVHHQDRSGLEKSEVSR